MPWRAGQEGKGSEATGSGRTRLWHESCPDTRSGTTPTGGARLSVAVGGEGRDGLGRRKKKSNGRRWGVWAGGEVNGPAALLSWAAGRKRRAGPVWAENEFSPFFSKRKTNTFKFKFEHKDSNSN